MNALEVGLTSSGHDQHPVLRLLCHFLVVFLVFVLASHRV